MRRLKIYERFNIHIYDICQEYGIENYVINSEGSISVDGEVDLSEYELTKLPVDFKEISGDLYLSENNLRNLKGVGETIGGSLDCYRNELISLEGCPERIGGWFDCSDNNLTCLKGCPKYIASDFNCCSNMIYTFEGIPDFTHIGGYFHCKGNLVHNIWRLFYDHTKFEFFNDCAPIRWIDNKPTVILDRLNFFLEETGHKTVFNVEGYINI